MTCSERTWQGSRLTHAENAHREFHGVRLFKAVHGSCKQVLPCAFLLVHSPQCTQTKNFTFLPGIQGLFVHISG